MAIKKQFITKARIVLDDGSLGEEVEYTFFPVGQTPFAGQRIRPVLLGFPSASVAQFLAAMTDCGETGEPEPEPTGEPTNLVDSYPALKGVRIRRDPVNTQGSHMEWTVPATTVCDFECYGPAGFVTKKGKTTYIAGAGDNYKQYQSLGVMPIGTYRLYVRPEGSTAWVKITFTVTADYDAVVYTGQNTDTVSYAILQRWTLSALDPSASVVINFVATRYDASGLIELCNATGECDMRLEPLEGQTGVDTNFYPTTLIGGIPTSGTYKGRTLGNLPPGLYRSTARPKNSADQSKWVSKNVRVGASLITAVAWDTIDTGVEDAFLVKVTQAAGVRFRFKYDQEPNWEEWRNMSPFVDPYQQGYQYSYSLPQGASSYDVEFETLDNPGVTTAFRFNRPSPQQRTQLFPA
ncbi:hypothetical protein DYU11_19995 [Fibrisoma montanum]|uniref:Uncharacterized protein n=1 Tax=Fibrisoma montanum TaxID=2305895 RepID=A0A418M3D5_9BACT|nr:hypothetical protein [Fibrisoma montanum]RIV20336.1 hypothetical protein DYU11_19995 [Fibrisoma montanum]